MDVKCPSCDSSDTAALKKQAEVYEGALSACLLDNKDVCTAFLTWGFTDKHSWLTKKHGEDCHPLPLDENYEKKPAYNSMLDILLNKEETLRDTFLQ